MNDARAKESEVETTIMCQFFLVNFPDRNCCPPAKESANVIALDPGLWVRLVSGTTMLEVENLYIYILSGARWEL